MADTEITASPLAAVLRVGQVRWVLTASLAGRLALGATPLAILLYAGGTHSASAAALLVSAYTAGTALGQPALARLTDRWSQPPVITAALALSTAGYLVLAALPGYWPQLVAALTAGIGVPPEACLRVLWKDLVAPGYLHSAYTLDIASQELIFIVGPLVAVAGARLVGTAGGLLVIAGAQLAGGCAFAAAPSVRQWRGEVAPRHWAGPLRSAGVRVLILITVLVGAAVGATTVAVAGYAQSIHTSAAAGWLLAAQATGALAGGLTVARWPRLGAPERLAAVVLVLAAGYLPPVLFAPLPVMLPLLGLSGVALPPALAVVFAATDRAAPAGTATEAFAWIGAAFAVGSALGSAVDGLVPGGHLAFLLAPLLIAVAAAVGRARAVPGARA